MSDFYIIFIEPKPGVTNDQVQEKINLALDWFRCTPNFWVVYTSSDNEKWFVRLKPIVEPGGSLFICRLDIKSYNGWMTKEFWDWLQKDRTEEEALTIMWPGKSGKKYKYWIYPVGSSFKEDPGNSIFAKVIKPGTWSPCYIGQTKNLNKRLEFHEKEELAKRRGATHIHAHLNSDENLRREEEMDLILNYEPPCNKA